MKTFLHTLVTEFESVGRNWEICSNTIIDGAIDENGKIMPKLHYQK